MSNMKAIKKLVFICLASILGLCSACMNDNPDFGRDDEGTGNTNQGEGQVRLAGTSVSVSVDVLSRADGKAINTDDYIIRIYSTDNNLLVKEYTRYRDMPEILTLNVGNYKIEALSHDVKPAEWEKPFYKGTQTFTIKKDEVTSVDVIKCF